MSLSSLIARSVCLVFGYVYPAYDSFKAIRTKDFQKVIKCLVFWIVMSLFFAFEFLADTFISWLPFYYELKLLFILFLLFPDKRGTVYMYQHLISPYFIEKEEVIDLTLAEAHLSFRKITYDVVQQGKVMVQHYTVEFLRKGQQVIAQQVVEQQLRALTTTPSQDNLLNSQQFVQNPQHPQVPKIQELDSEPIENPKEKEKEKEKEREKMKEKEIILNEWEITEDFFGESPLTGEDYQVKPSNSSTKIEQHSSTNPVEDHEETLNPSDLVNPIQTDSVNVIKEDVKIKEVMETNISSNQSKGTGEPKVIKRTVSKNVQQQHQPQHQQPPSTPQPPTSWSSWFWSS